jgi:hypothetical protein
LRRLRRAGGGRLLLLKPALTPILVILVAHNFSIKRQIKPPLPVKTPLM